MKVRHSSHQLPKRWEGLAGADRAVLIADIRLTPRARLYAKLLVFRNNRDLRRFWREGIGRDAVCRQTRGIVSQLRSHNIDFRKDGTEREYLEVDARYFAVIGLLVTHLGMEVITHESMHAGFAYAKRLGSQSKWYDDDNEEEEVCYAAAKIASAVNQVIRKSGLYGVYERLRSKKSCKYV